MEQKITKEDILEMLTIKEFNKARGVEIDRLILTNYKKPTKKNENKN